MAGYSASTSAAHLQFDRPCTPAMDSDHTSDSDNEDGLPPVPAALPASAGGITFISPFATFNSTSTALPVPAQPLFLSPKMQTPFSGDDATCSSPMHQQRRGSHFNTPLREELDNGDRRRNSVDAAVLQEFTPGNASYQRRASKRLRHDQNAIPGAFQAEPTRESSAHQHQVPTIHASTESGLCTETMLVLSP